MSILEIDNDCREKMGFHILFIHNSLNWIGDCPIVSTADGYKDSLLYQLKEIFDKNNIQWINSNFNLCCEDYDNLLKKWELKLSPNFSETNNIHKIGYFSKEEYLKINNHYLDFTYNSSNKGYIQKPIFGIVGMKIELTRELTDKDCKKYRLVNAIPAIIY